MKPRAGESLTNWVNAGRPCIAPPVKGAPTWREEGRAFGWNALHGWVVFLDGDAVTWVRPDVDLVQAYRLKPDGTRETVASDDAGHVALISGWFMSMDGFRAVIPGDDGMLYPETKPEPKRKTTARLRPRRKARGGAKRA